MNINNLSEFSSSYYEQANIYKIFSDAEDKEGFIWESIKANFVNKNVLDLGCGNGRYLKSIQNIAKYSIGIDQSFQQIKQANLNLNFLVADASNLPFSNNSFDIVMSCWVWGTILDLEKRTKVLNEAIRTLKPGGKIFLIENDTPSEFEYYRGRHLNNKTQEYNDWIIKKGFNIYLKLKTFISFEDQLTAKYVFENIWKDRLFDYPKTEKIENHVVIFQYIK